MKTYLELTIKTLNKKLKRLAQKNQ